MVKWLPSGDELIVVTSDGVPNEFINGEVQAWNLANGARRTLAKLQQQLWNDVVVSPDGKTVAIATDGVLLIDAVKGGPLRKLNTELRDIKLAWSSDGRVLAARGVLTGGSGYEVFSFDASMGKVLSHETRPFQTVGAFEINDKGQVTRDFGLNSITRRDGAGWKTVRRANRNNVTMMAVALSSDGKLWVWADLDGGVAWHDGETGRLLRYQPGLRQWAEALAWSPDGGTLAVGYGRRNRSGTYGEVELIDARTGRWQVALPAHQSPSEEQTGVNSVAWSPDGRFFVSSSSKDEGFTMQLRVWDGATHQHLRDVPLEVGTVRLRFSADGSTLLCGGSVGEILVWKNAARLFTENIAPDLVLDQATELNEEDQHDGAADAVMSLALSPDNRVLLVGSGNYVNGVFRAWDFVTGKPLAVLAKGPTVGSVTFSADGRHFWTGDAEGKIVEWDAETLKPQRTLSDKGEFCGSLLLSPNGRFLAAERGDVTLFSLPDGAISGVLTGSSSSINEIIISPDGRLLAGGMKAAA